MNISMRISSSVLSPFLIARIVEMRLGGKYTISKITETLQNVACSHLDQNLWLFDFADEVTDECNAVFGTDFGRKAMTLQEIKKISGKPKNTKITLQLLA